MVRIERVDQRRQSTVRHELTPPGTCGTVWHGCGTPRAMTQARRLQMPVNRAFAVAGTGVDPVTPRFSGLSWGGVRCTTECRLVAAAVYVLRVSFASRWQRRGARSTRQSRVAEEQPSDSRLFLKVLGVR